MKGEKKNAKAGCITGEFQSQTEKHVLLIPDNDCVIVTIISFLLFVYNLMSLNVWKICRFIFRYLR